MGSRPSPDGGDVYAVVNAVWYAPVVTDAEKLAQIRGLVETYGDLEGADNHEWLVDQLRRVLNG